MKQRHSGLGWPLRASNTRLACIMLHLAAAGAIVCFKCCGPEAVDLPCSQGWAALVVRPGPWLSMQGRVLLLPRASPNTQTLL